MLFQKHSTFFPSTFTLLAAFLLRIPTATSQPGIIISGGVLFDSVAYHNVPLEDTSMLRVPGDYCPLKMWSPTPVSQLHYPICVSLAQANAYAISWARDCGITDPAQVGRLRPSFAFIHKHIVKTRKGVTGARPEDGFNLLRDTGTCLEKTYRFYTALSRKPGKPEYDEASKYKIAYYKRLFNTTSMTSVKITQVQKMLMQCVPVVAVIWISEDFEDFKGHCWHPKAQPRQGLLHAVVVTGYDEARGEFELLNGYGEDWGEQGFFYLEEATLGRYLHAAYYMSLGEFTPPCKD